MTRHALFLIVLLAAASPALAQAPAPPAAPVPALDPNDYADEKNWLCRPGRKGDACDVDLTTTVVAADGTLSRETWTANPKAPIDCFYVYPTVSTDPGVFSDMTADPAETNVIHQCRKPGQVGCVINFSAFRSTVPPPANTLFGKAGDAAHSGSCTNPATLGEGSAPLHAYLFATGRTIAMAGANTTWVTGKTVDTPFVSVPGLLSGTCTTNEHATYLEITVNGNPSDPRTDDIGGDLGMPGKPIPMWGLHLVDVNLVMGNLLASVDQQAKTYLARK